MHSKGSKHCSPFIWQLVWDWEREKEMGACRLLHQTVPLMVRRCRAMDITSIDFVYTWLRNYYNFLKREQERKSIDGRPSSKWLLMSEHHCLNELRRSIRFFFAGFDVCVCVYVWCKRVLLVVTDECDTSIESETTKNWNRISKI